MPLDEHWGLGGLGSAGAKNHCTDCFLGVLSLRLLCQEFTSPLNTPVITLLGTSLIP